MFKIRWGERLVWASVCFVLLLIGLTRKTPDPVCPACPTLNCESCPSLESDFLVTTATSELPLQGSGSAIEQLRADLLNHSSLLPYQGVLGGTARFQRVYFLNSEWALAEVSDGHFAAEILLKYRVSNDGQIQWTLIDGHYPGSSPPSSVANWDNALTLLINRLEHDHLYDRIECVSFYDEGQDEFGFAIAVRSNAGGTCPGDPSVAPILNRFRVAYDGDIFQYQSNKDAYIFYDQIVAEKEAQF
ncbi:MAG: hypothetical protein ACTS2F_04360 [Thainema sp.]